MPAKLLARLRQAVRLRHYSPRTEDVYVRWVIRFVKFHGMRHPSELGREDISRFLSSLAVQRNVGASTQNQALAALLFLYRHVLGSAVGWLNDMVHAKRSNRLPVVLSRAEVRSVLGWMPEGVPRLVATLLYGTGMRLLEGLELRVKDVDFAGHEILVRAGKGDRDRVTMLPDAMHGQLQRHLSAV